MLLLLMMLLLLLLFFVLLFMILFLLLLLLLLLVMILLLLLPILLLLLLLLQLLLRLLLMLLLLLPMSSSSLLLLLQLLLLFMRGMILPSEDIYTHSCRQTNIFTHAKIFNSTLVPTLTATMTYRAKSSAAAVHRFIVPSSAGAEASLPPSSSAWNAPCIDPTVVPGDPYCCRRYTLCSSTLGSTLLAY